MTRRPDQPGGAHTLDEGDPGRRAKGVDENGIKRGPADSETPGLAAAGRLREARVGGRRASLLGVLHAPEPWRPGGKHRVEDPETAQDGHAWRHQSFAARLVAGEAGTVHDRDHVARSRENQRGGGAARPSRIAEAAAAR